MYTDSFINHIKTEDFYNTENKVKKENWFVKKETLKREKKRKHCLQDKSKKWFD